MSKLTVKHLSKSYNKFQVVRDVSLELAAGEVIGLLGPNGAGKTTSFYMIVGLVKSDSGEVWLDEHELSRLPIHQRAALGIGYLPQEPSIFRKLTAEENIRAVLELRHELNRETREQLLDQIFDELHINHIRQQLAISLSGGERRRVEIGRALAMEPRFMLLDEPFAGIDPISVMDLKRLINQLQERGIGVLITDHNVRDTLAICQRAYIVNAGTIIATGTTEEVMNNQEVRKVYLGEEFQL